MRANQVKYCYKYTTSSGNCAWKLHQSSHYKMGENALSKQVPITITRQLTQNNTHKRHPRLDGTLKSLAHVHHAFFHRERETHAQTRAHAYTKRWSSSPRFPPSITWPYIAACSDVLQTCSLISTQYTHTWSDDPPHCVEWCVFLWDYHRWIEDCFPWTRAPPSSRTCVDSHNIQWSIFWYKHSERITLIFILYL